MHVADQHIAIWRERLEARPPLLHARELQACLDLVAPAAARLRVEGLIEPICTGADFFRNHASRRFPTSMDMARVFSMSAPTAVLAGLTALRIAGAMYCMPSDKIEVSILPCAQFHSLPKHPGVDIRAHSVRWRSILEFNGVLSNRPVAGGEVNAMSPGAALAELLIFDPERAPEPDMIEFGSIDEVDQHRMRRLAGMPYGDHIKDVYAHTRNRHLLHAAARQQHARLRS